LLKCKVRLRLCVPCAPPRRKFLWGFEVEVLLLFVFGLSCDRYLFSMVVSSSLHVVVEGRVAKDTVKSTLGVWNTIKYPTFL
jgi:hypothetical protein